MDEDYKTVTMRVPLVAPFGVEVTADGVQEVWNAFVKPAQDADEPQSVEMRVLMAILRSTYLALGGE